MVARMSTKEQTNFDHARLLKQTLTLRREASKEFRYALRRAKEAAADDQVDLAIRWCIHGSTIAQLSNPGFFYSQEMEELLADIGRSNLASAPRPPEKSGNFKRFLHVLTRVYERGGHTRVVASWIDACVQFAPGEHHSVLISKQDELSVPTWLTDATRKSGGELIELSMELSWLERAAEMRSRSLEFDAIILHIHPNDPVPNIAFYDRSIPVLFFDHADHLFSLGVDLAAVIADLRSVGHDLSMRFRSPAARKLILPLPLTDRGPASAGKIEARRKLGLPVEGLLALTIGEPYKFAEGFGYSFPEVMQSICNGDSRVCIAAIGISESGPFPELKRLTSGQFMPVGFIKDREILELYYCAADVYLDSFPCTSVTAVLDAALRGLPVQTFQIPWQRMMWCDDPGIDSLATRATTQDEYVAGALELLNLPEDKRSELGARFRAAVLREHCGASWKGRWLDPAIDALRLPRNDTAHLSAPEYPGERESTLLWLDRTWTGNLPASMFVAGAILNTEEPKVYRMGVPKGTVRNSVGAGDSMVAGFIAGFLENGSYEHALRLGSAAGSASAFSEGLAGREEIMKLYDELSKEGF